MRTIIWDVDDVLNDLTRSWLQQAWLPAHAASTATYEALRENPPHDLLGVSREQYQASLDAFRLSAAGRTLAPDPAVLAWFQRRGADFHHVALTATPRVSAEHVAGWVLRHFGDWIRTFGFVPSARAGETIPAYARRKAEYLRWLGRGDVLVDDNPQTVAEVTALGVAGILVPRPWNQGHTPLIDALEAWAGVEAAERLKGTPAR